MKRFFIAFCLLTFVGGIAILAQDTTPEPSTGIDIYKIIAGVLGVTTMFFGGVINKGRTKLKQIIQLGKETVEGFDASIALGSTAVAAFDDNTVDEAEKKAIKDANTKMVKEWSDVKAQWKLIWKAA